MLLLLPLQRDVDAVSFALTLCYADSGLSSCVRSMEEKKRKTENDEQVTGTLSGLVFDYLNA